MVGGVIGSCTPIAQVLVTMETSLSMRHTCDNATTQSLNSGELRALVNNINT